MIRHQRIPRDQIFANIPREVVIPAGATLYFYVPTNPHAVRTLCEFKRNDIFGAWATLKKMRGEHLYDWFTDITRLRELGWIEDVDNYDEEIEGNDHED